MNSAFLKIKYNVRLLNNFSIFRALKLGVPRLCEFRSTFFLANCVILPPRGPGASNKYITLGLQRNAICTGVEFESAGMWN